MAQMEGLIDPQWALEVDKKHVDIWTYNGLGGEEIVADLDLRVLGGLTVPFGQELYTPEKAQRLVHISRLINLAFEEDGRLTLLRELVQAAARNDGTNHEHIKPFQARALTLPDEVWLIPTSAIQILTPTPAHAE